MSESDLREQLRGEVMAVGWEDLAPHYARGGLVLADPAIDLLEGKVAFVAKWLNEYHAENRLEGDHVFLSFMASLD